MKPRLWLKAKNITIPQFSRMIDKTPSSTYEYIYGASIPKRETIEKIRIVTLDAVRVEDFYELELTSIDKKIEKLLETNKSLWGWRINE